MINQANVGTWQQIFLVELDGPRKREITITG
ncbi:MAG: YjbQ family protein [Patescibacteria group bacterium]